MILKTYIFSQAAGLYQQYTTDNSETFLKDTCKKCSASDQIAIHRDGNLMYYAYIHKSLNSDFYGMCIVCGEVCLNIKDLYKTFQQTIENAAHKGVLFSYDDNGNIKKKVDYFSREAADVDIVFRKLKETLEERPSFWETLPPENLSIPLDSITRLSFSEDKANKIVDAIRHYHNVIITLEPTVPSSFSVIVRSKNDEIIALNGENQKLKDENKKVKRQKKQFQYVIILFIILIICGFGLLSLKDNLNLTQGKLDDANDIIESQERMIESKDSLIAEKDDTILNLNSTVSYLQTSVSNLQASVEDEKSKRENAEQALDDFKNQIKSSIPILITSIDIGNTDYNGNIITSYGSSIYSSSTMYLKPRITYTGLRSGESITLYVRFYTSTGALSTGSTSPSGYSYSESISVYSGSGNTTYLSGWGGSTKGHWGKGTYRFEIWYGNMCLKSKSFTVN